MPKQKFADRGRQRTIVTQSVSATARDRSRPLCLASGRVDRDATYVICGTNATPAKRQPQNIALEIFALAQRRASEGRFLRPIRQQFR